MKKCILIFCLFPLMVSAQYDFETRYFTINANSLPEVEDLLNFNFENKPLEKRRSLNEFEMSAENYRRPVDMATAIAEQKSYEARPFEVSDIRVMVYGFGDTAGYTADGSTTVTNIVYKEQRGLNFVDPCPPFGICPRCAPYRVGRGY